MDSGSTPHQGQEPEQDPAYQPTISGPAPPGYSPPAPPPAPGRRRRKVIGMAAVALVAVVVGAAIAVVLLHKNQETPTMMALQSGRALAPAAGLTLTGTMSGKAANVTVTRAGTVAGSYTQDLSRVSRVTVGGVTYLKAPSGFWDLEFDPTIAQQTGGHWAKVSPDDVYMSFASFTPGQISRVLEHVGEHPSVVHTRFGGREAIKLTAQRVVYYITSSIPNRLLHIDGTSGNVSYSFDVTPLTATTIGPVFTILHGDVQAMQGTPEPEAIVDPQQKVQFHKDCNGNSSCTVSIKVAVTDPVSSQVTLTMTVNFSGTRNGHAFATCTDTLNVDTSAQAAVAPSCGLGSPAWARWVNSHNSDFNTWAAPRFKVTVNSAGDIATMQRELNNEQGT